MPGRPSSKGYSRLSGSYESAPDEEGEDIKTEEVQDEGNEGEAKAAFLGLEDLQGDPHFVSLMILDHMLTEEVEEGDGGRCDDIAMMFINLTLLFLSHGCQLGLTYAFWKEFDAKNVHLNRDQWERNTGRFAWLMLMWRRGQLNWRTFHDLVDENVKSAENLIADERSASGAVDKEHV